jgi:membrane protein
MSFPTVWILLQRTFTAWTENEAPRLGAALAFYSTLSMAPLILIVVAIVSLFLGHSTAEAELLAQVEESIGPQGREVVQGLLRAQRPATGAVASLIGLATLLFAASGVFGELRAALNKIWGVRTEAQTEIAEMIRQRFFSFGMVLAVGFLLLISWW